MRSGSRRRTAGLALFALAIVLGSIETVRADLDASAFTPFTTVAAIAIFVGQLMPTYLASRVLVPLTTAPALGLVLAPLDFDGRAPGAATVLSLIWLTLIAGGLLRKALGRSVLEGSLGARFVGLVVTAYLAREVVAGDTSLVEWAFRDETRPAWAAMALLAVATGGGVVERVLDNVAVRLAEGEPRPSLAAAEVTPLVGVTAATLTTGPLIAFARPVLDWVAIPVLLLPVLLAHLAVQRVVARRRDLEQAMVAVARLPEIVGCTRTGHGRRVADLSTRIAEEMGVDLETSWRVERTALLHDVGQLGLREPLPDGATIHASSQVLARVAATSVRIIGSAPMFEELVPLVDQVRTPFRVSREYGEHIPLESRIVRVANAWDDITEGARSRRARQVALERLHLGLGYDYDPDVVTALEATLAG